MKTNPSLTKRSLMRAHLAAAPALLALALGCSSEVGNGRQSKGSQPGSGTGMMPGGPVPGPNDPQSPGTNMPGVGTNTPGVGTNMPGTGTGAPGQPSLPPGVVPGIRRLTHREYNQTISDVLGTALVTKNGEVATAGPADKFAADISVHGFDNARSSLVVTHSLADQYAFTAAELAEEFAPTLAQLAPCSGDEAQCAGSFVQQFGERLFRRPVQAVEVTRLTALFQSVRAKGTDYPGGIKVLLEAMLQSPQFLYRSEYGQPGAAGTRVLDAFETASLLSYTFWGAPPDDALVTKAKANGLGSAAEREAEARRLLGSPRAASTLARFFARWTGTHNLSGVVKDNMTYPMFDNAMRQSYVARQQSFIDGILVNGDGSLGTLLAGDTGLLVEPWLLAVHSHADESFPIARGVLVRTKLLCQDLPSPPPGLNVMPVERDPNATTRERFIQHSKDPACSGCHSLIDPIGFGFERYDGIGVYRTEENGKPVDDSGDVTQTEDANGPFKGPAELGTRLAGSLEVQRCAGRQTFRYMFGHDQDASDAAVMAPLLAEQGTPQVTNVREIFVSLVKSDRFVTRTAL